MTAEQVLQLDTATLIGSHSDQINPAIAQRIKQQWQGHSDRRIELTEITFASAEPEASPRANCRGVDQEHVRRGC